MGDDKLPTQSDADNKAAWDNALVRLERGDATELAELLRSDRAMPRDVRESLAELLSPEAWILDMRLVVKKGGRAKAERRMRLRSQAIAELERARAKGLSIEDAACEAGKTLGISGRAVLKRADLRNSTRFAEAHRDVSKIIVAVERAGGTKNFFQKLFETLVSGTSGKPGS